MSIEYKYYDAEIKDLDTYTGTVTGYFSSTGNIDLVGDVIEPGAYAKTLKENGPDSKNPQIFHLWMHDPMAVLGMPSKLSEDGKGLYFESKIVDNPSLTEEEVFTLKAITPCSHDMTDRESYTCKCSGGERERCRSCGRVFAAPSQWILQHKRISEER